SKGHRLPSHAPNGYHDPSHNSALLPKQVSRWNAANGFANPSHKRHHHSDRCPYHPKKHVYKPAPSEGPRPVQHHTRDRKSTRLNSSHVKISYAVFCLKKKKDGRRRGTVF